MANRTSKTLTPTLVLVTIFALCLSCALFHKGERADEVVIIAGGDILLDRGVRSAPGFAGDGHLLFDGIKSEISSADLAFANLECPLTSKCHCLPKAYCFQGDLIKARGLARAGFDVLTLANNHSCDCGRDALLDTMKALRSNGIVPVGAGANFAEAMKPTVFNIRGLRVKVLAFTVFPLEGLDGDRDLPAPAFAHMDEMTMAIEEAKKNTDVLIVTIHWGEEYSRFPSEIQKRLANAIANAGADLIIGHHPHVLQPCVKIGSTWVAYSLGNLVFDSRYPQTRLSALMKITASKNGRDIKAEFVPLEIKQYRPVAASHDAIIKIARSLNPPFFKTRSPCPSCILRRVKLFNSTPL